MAIFNGRDYSIVVSGVDLSNRLRQIRTSQNAEDLDGTAMGAVSRAHVPGLRDDRFEVTFFQDHAAGSVDATLSALQGVAAGGTVTMKPTSAAVSATNPSYSGTMVLLDYQPADVEVGNLSMVNATLVPAPGSQITRATV
jgi:hypothetical protein